ncbi:hypothetical protein ACFV4M_39145 [Kitasatospora indigofera]|uniref:hypothetical protein n=1 Tax=Kitasatospora indigofera TaxID=67307 RepID=UPI00364FC082
MGEGGGDGRVLVGLLECAAGLLERVGEVEAAVRLTLSVKDRRVVVEAVEGAGEGARLVEALAGVLGAEVDVDVMATGTGLAGVGTLAEGVFAGVAVRATASRFGAVPGRAPLPRALTTAAFAGRLRALTGWAGTLGQVRELVVTDGGPFVRAVLRARWATLSAVLDDLSLLDLPPLPYVVPGGIGVEPAAGRFGLRVLPGGPGHRGDRGDRLDLQHDPDESVGEAQDGVNIATALLVCALVPEGSAQAVELWVPEMAGALPRQVPRRRPLPPLAGTLGAPPGAEPPAGAEPLDVPLSGAGVPAGLRSVDARGRTVRVKRDLQAYLYVAARAAAVGAAPTFEGRMAAAALAQWAREQPQT